ncbi:MAG: NnrU family protein [Mangrovicoccus sp.]
MFWLLLLLGIGLWVAAHSFKRWSPIRREAMGQKGKGLVALAIAAGIVLMIIGYRGTPFITVWTPPSFLTHLNNLLVLLAFFLMSPAPKKGKLFNFMRHPMLTGFGLWAFAHLLVNGDLASILLFGGLLVWSAYAAQLVNRAEPGWVPGPKGKLAWDLRGFAGAVVLLVVVGYIHSWLGPWPFG